MVKGSLRTDPYCLPCASHLKVDRIMLELCEQRLPSPAPLLMFLAAASLVGAEPGSKFGQGAAKAARASSNASRAAGRGALLNENTTLNSSAAGSDKVPGTNFIGEAFDIMRASPDGIDSSSGQIFSFVYNQTTTVGAQEYSYAWGTTAASVPKCDYRAQTSASSSFEEYKEHLTASVSMGGSYEIFTGSLQASVQAVNERVSGRDQTVSRTRVMCQVFDIRLLPGYVPLSLMFLQAVYGLPTTYDASSAGKFDDFLSTWGTHVVTGCKVGGTMTADAFTDASYVKTHRTFEVEAEAKADFTFVNGEAKATGGTDADKEFKDATTFGSIEQHGGTVDSSDNWVQWARSVQSLNSPVCFDWSAVEIATVLGPSWVTDPEINARVLAVERATEVFFARTGCTNPSAINYNKTARADDGSCVWPPPGTWKLGDPNDSCKTVCSSARLTCADGDWGVHTEASFLGALAAAGVTKHHCLSFDSLGWAGAPSIFGWSDYGGQSCDYDSTTTLCDIAFPNTSLPNFERRLCRCQ